MSVAPVVQTAPAATGATPNVRATEARRYSPLLAYCGSNYAASVVNTPCRDTRLAPSLTILAKFACALALTGGLTGPARGCGRRPRRVREPVSGASRSRDPEARGRRRAIRHQRVLHAGRCRARTHRRSRGRPHSLLLDHSLAGQGSGAEAARLLAPGRDARGSVGPGHESRSRDGDIGDAGEARDDRRHHRLGAGAAPVVGEKRD